MAASHDEEAVQGSEEMKSAKKPTSIGSKHPSGPKPVRKITPHPLKSKGAQKKTDMGGRGKGNPNFQLNTKPHKDDPKESYKPEGVGGQRNGKMKAIGPMKAARKGMQPKFPEGGIP